GYKDAISPVVRVELRYSSGNYQIRVQVRKDFLFANTSYYTISDGEHYIEFDWEAASSPGANDGELTLYIDGDQKEQLTSIDNDTMYIDRVRLGAVTEIDTGTRGTYYFDAFESRTEGYIGPVAMLPGFPVAQDSPVEGMLANVSYWILSLLQNIWEKITSLINPNSALASDTQEDAAPVVVMAMAMSQAAIPEGQVWKSYYYAGSQRVAMRVQEGVTDEVYYLFSDHLGSTSVSYRVSDGYTITQFYYPWGGVRSGPENVLPTDYTFTGQRTEVDSFGLMYYNARWYDPALGRFAQADSIVPSPGNPLAWDRYSYSNNNPLTYIDPSGYTPWYIAGWDDDYRQQQDGNTCAVVSATVAISILYGSKHTQQDIQFAFAHTYKLMFEVPVLTLDGNQLKVKNRKFGYPGLGVIPQEQAFVINALDPSLEAVFTQGTRADLLNNLNNGYPTIVNLALKPWVFGHALVAIGYDPDTDELWFFDPAYGDIKSENDILQRYDKGRGYSSFDDLWSASNVFISSNSMVTVRRVRVKLPENGIIAGGGNGRTHGLHFFR
ncbi:MAG: RHS repeat-associated core domain-containing protein, partial [Chloroflexota bacterium]|nr:RHS repeat-associated core domain-containing protein [Chloroflexota bacterium]